MTAFEVHLNGRKTCTAGLGEAGVVASNMTWWSGVAQKKMKGALEFRVSGLISWTCTRVDRFSRRLPVGGEVKIVVIKKSKVDCPKKKPAESKASRSKRERDYVETKAAEFGSTITK